VTDPASHMPDYSEHIVYVDESGDHGLASIDPNYPVFVLAFCIFKKDDYCSHVQPAVTALKFKHFGHDMVVLHEYEIRKKRKPFGFLKDPARHPVFMKDLDDLVAAAPFTLIASVIRKEDLKAAYGLPDNPYHLALSFGLERIALHLGLTGAVSPQLHVVFEQRGKKEDQELELEFRRICDGHNATGKSLPFEIEFADKQVNSSGLQFADLLARPIGRKIIAPKQPNRAYDTIHKKLRKNPWSGGVKGWGLKVFP